MNTSLMKNIHLEHPEDVVLTGDLSVLDWFCEKSTLSVKIDGSPAIVWGTNPATQKFFVGTKAVFNKVKIRIAHSHEEIDTFYQGEVANILHACFDYLPRTNFIFQGDFVGFGGSDTVNTQLIIYKFPEVIDHEIIIAPHTVYTADNDLREAVAYPMDFNITDTSYCKFIKPDAWIVHNQESFSDVKEVCDFARQMATTVQFVDKKGAEHLKKTFNTFIKNRAVLDDNALSIFGNCDINLIRLWKLVKSIKEDCLYLCRCNGPEAYIGQERVVAEGFVMTNKYGTYKLVNREVFSYANFTQQKTWTNK